MNKLLDQNLGRLWASLIINEFIQNKITQFYVSPGMRNAPLIAAIEHSKKFHPEINMHICIDERAASYRALGFSKSTGKASVLICTSGTAMANYFPAIIESKKSNIPLIIVSADRPSELTYCDDNQTIDQTKMYHRYVQGELNLGTPSLEISPLALTSSLSNLIHKAFYPQNGPVHFNAPFREPLEATKIDIPAEYLNLANVIINNPSASTDYLELETRLTDNALNKIADIINQSKSGLLVIGSLSPYDDLAEVRSLIRKLNWPTYLDVSSCLKFEYNLNDNTLPTFDHPEVQSELNNNPPETVFHIGGRLTSKHYYSFLKANPKIKLITLNKNIEKEDPSHHTKYRLNASINPTLKDLNPLIHQSLNDYKINLNFEAFTHQKINLIENGPLSFPKISKTILDNIDNHAILYLGNSTAVRSFDSYFSYTNKKSLTIATNRGVSGIEGMLASTVGLIDGLKKTAYLIIGDISFLHDLNSIYFLKELKTPVKIILINNFSGGIFTLLPIDKEKDVIKHVSSPHQITFEKIAGLCDIHYSRIKNANDLKNTIDQIANSNKHEFVEILVDNEINKKMYDVLKTIKF